MSYTHFEVSMVLLRNQKMKKAVIALAGDKGFLFADYAERRVVLSSCEVIRERTYPPAHDCKVILKNMVDAIRGKTDPIAGADAGLASLKTVLSLYKAMRVSRRVRL